MKFILALSTVWDESWYGLVECAQSLWLENICLNSQSRQVRHLRVGGCTCFFLTDFAFNFRENFTGSSVLINRPINLALSQEGPPTKACKSESSFYVFRFLFFFLENFNMALSFCIISKKDLSFETFQISP